MLKKMFALSVVFILAGCSAEPDKVQETIINTDSVNVSSDTLTKQISLNDLEIFSNMEQVDFCVPVPLSEYALDTKNEYERAKFVFINKKNVRNELILQGMFRDDPKISIDEYFKNAYPPEGIEEGKNIEEKAIVNATNCFYAIGFWSNLALDQRFIEIIWLRKDDLVKLYVSFDLKDTTLWNSRAKKIIQTDSYCK